MTPAPKLFSPLQNDLSGLLFARLSLQNYNMPHKQKKLQRSSPTATEWISSPVSVPDCWKYLGEKAHEARPGLGGRHGALGESVLVCKPPLLHRGQGETKERGSPV